MSLRRLLGFIALPLALGSGCTKTECVSDEAYFEANVLPTLQRNCSACHNATGEAQGRTEFILPSASLPDFQAGALAVFTQMAATDINGKPALLMKPSMQVPHEGKLRFEKDSVQYKAFENMLARLKKPTTSCPNEVRIDTLKDIQPLSDAQTLRKATIALAGRIPTDAEVEAIRADPGVFDAQLDAIMNEEAFYEHVREWMNDVILTDRFTQLPGLFRQAPADGVLSRFRDNPNNDQSPQDYPNQYWYESLANDDAGKIFGNNSLSREPLELVVHVVKENRPFTEILTADYTMVNGYSAVSYGLNFGIAASAQQKLKFRPISENPKWADVKDQTAPDPSDYKEAKLPGYPHAGIIGSPWFNARYETSDTNVNRKRARFVFKYFLATDVLRDQERPVDLSGVNLAGNPTKDDANCQGCHGVVDPVAGAFQDFNNDGRWKIKDKGMKFTFMRPPGFKDEIIPADQLNTAIQWMAQRVASDPRFLISSVRLAYTGVTGQKPLDVPTDQTDPLFDAKMRAFRIQADIIKDIGDKFAADNYNFKSAIKAVIKSPLFRAYDTVSGLSASREAELYDIGTASLNTPENFARKIRAVAGYPWRNNTGGTEASRRRIDDDLPISFQQYRSLLGGIDSEGSIVRLRIPNAIIASSARVMANSVACLAVPQDFAKPIEQRELFRHVETSFQPEDENGFLVDGSVEKIKQNIAYLHWRVLGEEVDVTDPEVERTYQLFLETWREGRDGFKAQRADPMLPRKYSETSPCGAQNEFYTGKPLATDRRISNDSRYTIRSWMAVMSYLLSDHNFLYE